MLAVPEIAVGRDLDQATVVEEEPAPMVDPVLDHLGAEEDGSDSPGSGAEQLDSIAGEKRAEPGARVLVAQRVGLAVVRFHRSLTPRTVTRPHTRPGRSLILPPAMSNE